VNEIAFRKYRKVRIIFWVSFVAAFVFFFIEMPVLAGFLFIVAFISSTVSIFMPCPFCGKTIGYLRWGIMMVGNSFGGWCLHCSSRLFAISPNKSLEVTRKR
jgi:hypothetical protein